MRKLIVACLLFGFLASGSASTVSQEPTVPGPSNPYCNTKASDFPMPEIICPDDGYYVVNAVCAFACRETYRTKMVEIYNNACRKYANADEQYKQCFNEALDAHRVCDGGAITAAQIQACRNNLITSVTNCMNTLNTTRTGIATNVDSDSAAAKSAFQSCVSACCIKVGQLGGDSNGGKIGRQDVPQ